MIARSMLIAALLAAAAPACAPNPAAPSVALTTGLTPRLETVYDRAALEERDQVFHVRGTGEPATGTVEAVYPSGAKKARFALVEGRAEGVWIEWYETGAVRYVGEWRDGRGHGLWLNFHPSGEISERVRVREDVFDGPAEGWTPEGRKAFEAAIIGGDRRELWSREED